LGEALKEVAPEEAEDGASFLILAGVDEFVLDDLVWVREVGGKVDAMAEAEAREVNAGEAFFV